LGFIRFDDGARDRLWTTVEENLLAGFANSLSQAIARNRAEAELSNASHYLDSLINVIPASVFVKDRQHRSVLVNDACCALNNLKREEMLGKTEADLFDTEGAESVRKQEEAVFQSGQPMVNEETIVRNGKTALTVITQKAPFTNHHGKSFLMGCNLDITDWKQAEKSLIKEQHLGQAFLDYTPDCIYFKDKHSHFLRVNKTMASWLGLTDSAQIIGKTDFDLFSDEHARKAFAMEEQIIQTGTPVWNTEQKEVWPREEVKWISLTKMPLYGYSQEGEIIGTFGICRDITESKKGQIALTNSRNYLNHIFEAIPIPVFVKDSTHRWISLNDAWYHFTGVDRQTV